MVGQDLKKYMPSYEKSRKTIFFDLLDKIEVAKANAIRSLECAHLNQTDNPSTYVHELVHYLQNLKKKPRRNQDSESNASSESDASCESPDESGESSHQDSHSESSQASFT
jgi:hypothetical protein